MIVMKNSISVNLFVVSVFPWSCSYIPGELFQFMCLREWIIINLTVASEIVQNRAVDNHMFECNAPNYHQFILRTF